MSEPDTRSRAVVPTVVYLPVFDNQDDFDNHYHRARWYLPRVDGVLERVVMGAAAPFPIDRRPACMGGSLTSAAHIEVVAPADTTFLNIVAQARMVLLWRAVPEEVIASLRERGIQVVNIATDDPEAVEYGRYGKVHWDLMSRQQRERLLGRSAVRFRRFCEETWDKGYEAAAVFGTGPSIDEASRFDLSRCFTHICNTTVQSEALLEHISPDIISAGDVVSHFGVSRYAEKFRGQLADYMRHSSCYFLTTARFGYLFTVHYPDLKEQVLLCEQKGPQPNYNLRERWLLPGLDSTLNIHMLPTAATLFDDIFILGCDGKNPDPSKNEDFWAHSRQAQYHDLVDTGHEAHPTFDKARQASTWERFKNSVRTTLDIGEARFGKRYRTLAPSFTPGLDTRHIDAAELARQGIIGVTERRVVSKPARAAALT